MTKDARRVSWDNQLDTPDPSGVFLVQLDAYLQNVIGAKLLSLGLLFPDVELIKSLKRSATVDQQKRNAYQWLGIQIMSATPFQLDGDFTEGEDWGIDVDIDEDNPAHYTIHATHPPVADCDCIVSVGEVTTLEPGENATVEVTAGNVINFGIPKGEKGDTGNTGADGLPGIDGVDGRDGVDGQQGIQGIQGQPGQDGVDGQDCNCDPTPIEQDDESPAVTGTACNIAKPLGKYLKEQFSVFVTVTRDAVAAAKVVSSWVTDMIEAIPIIGPVVSAQINFFADTTEEVATELLSVIDSNFEEDVQCHLYCYLKEIEGDFTLSVIAGAITDLQSWSVTHGTVGPLFIAVYQAFAVFLGLIISGNMNEIMRRVSVFAHIGSNCELCDECEEPTPCLIGVADFTQSRQAWEILPDNEVPSAWRKGGEYVDGVGFRTTTAADNYGQALHMRVTCDDVFATSGYSIKFTIIPGAYHLLYISEDDGTGTSTGFEGHSAQAEDSYAIFPINEGTKRILLSQVYGPNVLTVTSVEIYHT